MLELVCGIMVLSMNLQIDEIAKSPDLQFSLKLCPFEAGKAYLNFGGHLTAPYLLFNKDL